MCLNSHTVSLLLLEHTRRVIVLEDNDVLHLTGGGYGIYNTAQQVGARARARVCVCVCPCAGVSVLRMPQWVRHCSWCKSRFAFVAFPMISAVL